MAMYTPFDFNEAVGHRKEYIEDRLREGSPVVGLAYESGLLLFTVRRTQRKIYEIYDRQMFSAIGNQSDIEAIRLAAINMAHQEGFERSPDDVSIQRLVGFSLSPAIKKSFGDQMVVPFVLRALFAEIGLTADQDIFYTLNYDGEFSRAQGSAVVAGTQSAEDAMALALGGGDTLLALPQALELACRAWCAGIRDVLKGSSIGVRDDEQDPDAPGSPTEADDRALLRDELKTSSIEAAVLERNDVTGVRFRLLTSQEIDAALTALL